MVLYCIVGVIPVPQTGEIAGMAGHVLEVEVPPVPLLPPAPAQAIAVHATKPLPAHPQLLQPSEDLNVAPAA